MADMSPPEAQDHPVPAGGEGLQCYSRKRKRERLHNPSEVDYGQQGITSDKSPQIDQHNATANAGAEKVQHHGGGGGGGDHESGENQMLNFDHLGGWGRLQSAEEEDQQEAKREEEAQDIAAGGNGGGGGSDHDSRSSRSWRGARRKQRLVNYQYLSGGVGSLLPEQQELEEEREEEDKKHLEEEEGEEGDEDVATSNPFMDYRPSQLDIGTPHPDPVVETSALSAVQMPETTYVLAIAEEIEQSRALSCLQLETLVYASQRHLQLLPNGSRAGFFLGDGAGVGKGRTIAGLKWENWQQGRRRALWLSVGSDLRFDARRDLNDVGASCIPLHALNKLSYAKLESTKVGVKEGVLFLTYNSLIAKSAAMKSTRFQQLEEWCGYCGKDFDGLIAFDECHKAKNLVAEGSKKASSQTGRAVRDLQESLPLARVLYCSATGASEPRNMAYMVRLGLWGIGTNFLSFEEFLQGLERGVWEHWSSWPWK
ncbi:hypothetical protein L7F22_061797 [Adiantum nelumboides]|nr:hypothetical protein [Adiantum nelumboides]